MGLIANAVGNYSPVQLGLEWLSDLLADYPKRNVQVRLWEGSSVGSKQPSVILVIKSPSPLREMFLSPNELTLGESYIFDELDIQGDIEAAFDLADYLLAKPARDLPLHPDLATVLRRLPVEQEKHREYRTVAWPGSIHSKERDRQAISFHYDLPPEFFALWLDRHMVYSCAYFADGDECDLDTAQRRKLDYICRKLRLHRGDCLLDVGCGWGGLLIHAATHYGVQGLGVTLSVRQAEVAQQRIRDSGLNNCCRVEVRDYRDLEPGRQFDKIVSVGMFEHVGQSKLPEYFSQMWRLLRPGGTFMNSGIAASSTYRRRGPSFIERYVFPDGELVPLNISLGSAERTGFEVRDIESLREHYALTLHHWVHRLETHAENARGVTDDITYRIWRLYMAASAHAFRSGRLNLYQMLLAKPLNGQSGMPLTRADWYVN
jgi:cyclopropane-fatty-acyl-phospholipid synthase